MKKIIYILSILLLSANIYSQQLPYNNQLIFNKFSYIPATAGLSRTAEGFLGFKQQWLGIKGAPTQENFYFHTPMSNNMGIGTSMIMEQTGNFSTFYFSATYSYHIPFGDNVFLSVGLTPNFARNQLDFSKIQSFGYQIDPALQNTNTLFVNIADFGISMLFYANGFNFGVNIPRTIALTFPYHNLDIQYKTEREYFAFLSYKTFITENLQIEPLINIHTNELWKPDLGGSIMVKYQNYWIATGYNSDRSILFSIGAISKSNILISYSYNLGINTISAASNGTHEITIGFLLGKKQNPRLLATIFNARSEKEQQIEEIKKDIAKLDTRLANEMTQRTYKDNDIQQQIDSLKKICASETSNNTTKPITTEPQWIDTITTYNINFGYMNDKIFSSNFPELDKYAEILNKNPSIKMKILVYTDNIFSEEFNKELSQKRAKAIADYYLAKPNMEGRIFYEGKGSAEPIAPNNTPEGRMKNNRVQFLFNKKINN